MVLLLPFKRTLFGKTSWGGTLGISGGDVPLRPWNPQPITELVPYTRVNSNPPYPRVAVSLGKIKSSTN